MNTIEIKKKLKHSKNPIEIMQLNRKMSSINIDKRKLRMLKSINKKKNNIDIYEDD